MKNTRNLQKQSRFICLQCNSINHVGDGIHRKKQREKYHIKDLYCVHCKEITKNMEVRYCDSYEEVKFRANRLCSIYYNKKGKIEVENG